MSILSSQLVTTGTADSPTSIIYLLSNDTLSGVQVAGYLSKNLENLTYQLSIYQLAVVYTTDAGTVILQVSYANSVWSLVNNAVADVVATPTVANQIAYATNTGGSLAASGLSTALFNGGNLSAGISGTAGALYSFPSAATSGKLGLAAVANSGNFTTTISNAAAGQSTAMSFADVGAATGQFLVKTAALVNGNLVQASGTAGITVDSGVATTNVQLKANIKAATTASYAGGGTSNAFTATLLPPVS